jgi:hypothetical protein
MKYVKKYIDKSNATLVLTWLWFSQTIGQVALPTRKADLDITKFNTVIIDVKSSESKTQVSHIASIHIVDARPDTLSVGLAQNYNERPYFINVKDNFSNVAQVLIDNEVDYDKTDSLSVVMIVKKFWISGILDKDNTLPLNGLNKDTVSQRVTNLQAKIEFYLKYRSDYYTLYRFDSTFRSSRWPSQDASEMFAAAFKTSLSKLLYASPVLYNMMTGKRKFSLEEIIAHDKKIYDLPILTDTALTAGVYFSFEDFKNNNPSEKHFEISNDKLTSLIFINQPDGKPVAVKDAWGYCDGKNLFVRSLSNYFRLQRRGNSFYIYGSKRYRHKTVFSGEGIITSTVSGNSGGSYVPGESNSEGFNLKLRPFELDWDDGQLR